MPITAKKKEKKRAEYNYNTDSYVSIVTQPVEQPPLPQWREYT